MFTFFSEQKFIKTGQFSEFLKLFLDETFWVIFKHLLSITKKSSCYCDMKRRPNIL